MHFPRLEFQTQHRGSKRALLGLRHVRCIFTACGWSQFSARLAPFLLQWGLALLLPKQEVSPRAFRSNTLCVWGSHPQTCCTSMTEAWVTRGRGIGQKEPWAPRSVQMSRELKLGVYWEPPFLDSGRPHPPHHLPTALLLTKETTAGQRSGRKPRVEGPLALPCPHRVRAVTSRAPSPVGAVGRGAQAHLRPASHQPVSQRSRA